MTDEEKARRRRKRLTKKIDRMLAEVAQLHQLLTHPAETIAAIEAAGRAVRAGVAALKDERTEPR